MAEHTLSPESPLKTISSFSEHDLQLERQAVRRLDYTIIPVLSMLYLLLALVCTYTTRVTQFLISLQDRTNIGKKNSITTRHEP